MASTEDIPGRMSRPLIRLGRDTMLYGVGEALQRAIGLVLFPLYTRTLTQEAYGAQDLVFTTLLIGSYVLTLGMESGAGRHYYDAESPEERRRILSTWVRFQAILCLAACGGGVFLAGPLCWTLLGDRGLAGVFRIGLIALAFGLCANVALTALRLTFRSGRYVFVSVTAVAAHGAAAVIFVPVMGLGVKGVFLAYLTAQVFRFLLGFTWTRGHFTAAFSRAWLRPMLIFGLPFVPASLSLWVLNYSNRYFLLYFKGFDEVALFSAGVKISSILTFAVLAFQTSWGPLAYSLIRDESLARETYARVMHLFLPVTLFLAAGLSLFAREALRVLAPSAYGPSAGVVPWLCFGAIAWGGFYIAGIGFGIAKKSIHTLVATLVAALSATGLNILLIPRFGATGASLSTMAGNILALVYALFVGRRYFPVPYDIPRMAGTVAVSTLTILAGAWLDWTMAPGSWALPAFKGALIAFFPVGLVALNIIKKEDIIHGMRRVSAGLESGR